ncbi:MAG: class I SAM-dependent methyltransferase [Nitriliruptoraceae bacterium]
MTAASWRDHRDQPTTAPDVPGPDTPAFYLDIGQFQGEHHDRNAFAAGTEEEVAALTTLLGLGPGTRVLDVGCAEGRHLRMLGLRGIVGTGVDVSPALVRAGQHAAAEAGAAIELAVADARRLETWLQDRAGTFDVAWSLCQGGLGTSPVTDPAVVAGLAAAVRPGGTVALTLFHALFAARHLAPGDAFDTLGLVHHQRSEVRGPDHARRQVDLWTTAYTARDAARLVSDAGLELCSIRGVEPGAYGRRCAGEVALDDPELLVIARRPAPPPSPAAGS